MGFKGSGAPGQTRTGDPLLRSRLSTFIKTCRSERKAGENQQVVTTSDQLLAPSSSPLSRFFAAICHNYYYVSMTGENEVFDQCILIQPSDVGSIPTAPTNPPFSQQQLSDLSRRQKAAIRASRVEPMARKHESLRCCAKFRQRAIQRTYQMEGVSTARVH